MTLTTGPFIKRDRIWMESTEVIILDADLRAIADVPHGATRLDITFSDSPPGRATRMRTMSMGECVIAKAGSREVFIERGLAEVLRRGMKVCSERTIYTRTMESKA